MTLVERLCAATGPSRELDAEIFIAVTPGVKEAGRIDRLGGLVGWWPKDAPYHSAVEVPQYSSSLDAAMTLIGEADEYEISTIHGVAVVSLPLNSDHCQTVTRKDGNVILAFVECALRARGSA